VRGRDRSRAGASERAARPPRWPSWLVALQALGLLVCTLFYRFLGARLIADAYRGESLELLNRVMAGRGSTPLASYIADADVLIGNLLVLAATVLLLELCWLVMRRRRGAATAPVARGRTASSAGRLAVFRLLGGTLAVLALVALYGAFYRVVFLGRLIDYHGVRDPAHQEPDFPGLESSQVLQLGWAQSEQTHPSSSYLLFDPAKPAGTLRIGIFGGSFVEGQESASGHDLASFLQRQLEAAGVEPVEVINFGARGYGMHQAHLLWKFLGRRYDLDYTIAVPFAFHIQRDQTFLYDVNSYGPIHARYAVDQGALRLVRVVGDDRADASRRYYRALPPWRYLRYDARTPTLLRPLLPGQDLQRWNPLYHRGSTAGEALETYRLLFGEMAREARNLVLLTLDDEVAGALEPALAREDAYLLHSQRRAIPDRLSSFYNARQGHWSALGNEFLAAELAALLLGRDRLELAILSVEEELPDPKRGSPLRLASLAEAGDATLRIGDQAVARFLRRLPDQLLPWGFEGELRFSEQAEIQSLVRLARPQGFVFIPLDFRIQDGDPVKLELDENGAPIEIALGSVRTRDGIVGRLDLRLDALERRSNLTPLPGGHFHELLAGEAFRADRARITIAGRPALDGRIRQRDASLLPGPLRRPLLGRRGARTISFHPVVADYLGFRQLEGQYLDLQQLDSERGTVALSVLDPDRGEAHLPLLSYRIERFRADPFDRPYPAPIPRATTEPR
jgi:hypothetical protein